jgi:hypothetical protein
MTSVPPFMTMVPKPAAAAAGGVVIKLNTPPDEMTVPLALPASTSVPPLTMMSPRSMLPAAEEVSVEIVLAILLSA